MSSRIIVIGIAIIVAMIVPMKNTPDTDQETILIIEETVSAETSEITQDEIVVEDTQSEGMTEEIIEDVDIVEVAIEDIAEDYYYIKVNIETQVVTIYTQDSEGEYTNAVKAFVCSTGDSTPDSGTYETSTKYRWHELYYDVYGQYCIRITGDILFHSVPYTTYEDAGSLIAEEYDKLGTDASAGCVRMPVEGVEWIYNNCPSGTLVEFMYSSTDPIEAEEVIKISEAEGDLVNWDPTDSDSDNPWIEYFEALSEKEVN